MGDRESVAVGLLAVAYLAAAIALAELLPWSRPLNAPLVAAIVLVNGILARIRVDVGAGSVSPTQLAFVPLLFLAPLPLVPLVVPVIIVLEELPDILMGRSHPHRWLNWLADSWFVVGPVLVLALWAPEPPAWSAWPIYLAALAAQVGGGIAFALVRERAAGRVAWRDELRSAVTAYQLEVLLAPAGVAAVALALAVSPLAGLAFVAAGGAGLWRAAAWHQARCDREVARHRTAWKDWLADSARCERARRGHVGPDWQSTPTVALALARELAVPTREQRQLAYVAHYAAVAGPEGPAQLAFAQLVLGVAAARNDLPPGCDRLVRDAQLLTASLSRWDGQGDDPPLTSRVVAVARAYSGLTASAEGRAALSREAALEQLSRVAGRELDPAVVAALERAVRDSDAVAVQPAGLVGRLPALAALR